MPRAKNAAIDPVTDADLGKLIARGFDEGWITVKLGPGAEPLSKEDKATAREFVREVENRLCKHFGTSLVDDA